MLLLRYSKKPLYCLVKIMAVKKPEQMTADELKQLIMWYESRLKYVRYLLSEVGGH